MPKICFVEATAYSVLNPKTGRSSTGGEAVQHTLLAKEFARSGWDTSMVSLDIGQTNGDVFDVCKSLENLQAEIRYSVCQILLSAIS